LYQGGICQRSGGSVFQRSVHGPASRRPRHRAKRGAHRRAVLGAGWPSSKWLRLLHGRGRRVERQSSRKTLQDYARMREGAIIGQNDQTIGTDYQRGRYLRVGQSGVWSAGDALAETFTILNVSGLNRRAAPSSSPPVPCGTPASRSPSLTACQIARSDSDCGLTSLAC
jgi:hypothetical protein